MTFPEQIFLPENSLFSRNKVRISVINDTSSARFILCFLYFDTENKRVQKE